MALPGSHGNSFGLLFGTDRAHVSRDPWMEDDEPWALALPHGPLYPPLGLMGPGPMGPLYELLWPYLSFGVALLSFGVSQIHLNKQ